jgi:hypothetical protein
MDVSNLITTLIVYVPAVVSVVLPAANVAGNE